LEIEKEFITESLPVSLIGMNAELMKQYLEFVVDGLLSQMGCEKEFNSKNPFEFMNQIALKTKQNFFEGRSTEYKSADLSGPISFDEEI
jgi:ribonucleoside-diphosphate reductase beta chain